MVISKATMADRWSRNSILVAHCWHSIVNRKWKIHTKFVCYIWQVWKSHWISVGIEVLCTIWIGRTTRFWCRYHLMVSTKENVFDDGKYVLRRVHFTLLTSVIFFAGSSSSILCVCSTIFEFLHTSVRRLFIYCNRWQRLCIACMAFTLHKTTRRFWSSYHRFVWRTRWSSELYHIIGSHKASNEIVFGRLEWRDFRMATTSKCKIQFGFSV